MTMHLCRSLICAIALSWKVESQLNATEARDHAQLAFAVEAAVQQAAAFAVQQLAPRQQDGGSSSHLRSWSRRCCPIAPSAVSQGMYGRSAPQSRSNPMCSRDLHRSSNSAAADSAVSSRHGFLTLACLIKHAMTGKPCSMCGRRLARLSKVQRCSKLHVEGLTNANYARLQGHAPQHNRPAIPHERRCCLVS
jgi:hypothetical protein